MRRAVLPLAWGALWLAVVTGAAWHWSATWFEAPGPHSTQIVTNLPKGASLSGIASRLRAAGAIQQPWLFVVNALLSGNARKLKAGEYAIAPRASQRDILAQIAAGNIMLHAFTIPEGLSVAEILRRVAAADELSGALPPPPPEGSMLPETYFFPRGESRAALIGRLRISQQALLDRVWAARAAGLPLDSQAQAVILASIVEKETGIAAERPQIAGVFYNRLALGMALQSDPTVVYARDKGEPNPKPLSGADLAIDSPYNTYTNPGLPPGPIANPGRAALEAVLRPAATDALYFVADGTGGHVFSASLIEHNKNVAKLRARERAKP